MKKSLILVHLSIMISLLFSFSGLTLAINLKPNKAETEQEEYALKRLLRPVLIDVLKDKYVTLSVNVLYILQRDPILTKNSDIEQFSLPGFGNRATLANKPGQITGFLERYVRHRFLILLVATPLNPSVEQSLTHLLKDKIGLELGIRDTFTVEVIAPIKDIKAGDYSEQDSPFNNETADEKKEKEIDDLIDEMDKEKAQKQKRMERLFPGIDKKPEEIDPRKEAESSKHLILSRQAFFKNDLNTALNEVISAININPYSAKSYEMLGSIYYRLKWKNLALNNWTKALALDPDNRKLNMFIDKVKNEL